MRDLTNPGDGDDLMRGAQIGVGIARRMSAPSLDAAWFEAVAALPEGVGLELAKLAYGDWAEAIAGDIIEQAESPIAALRALTASLKAEAAASRRKA